MGTFAPSYFFRSRQHSPPRELSLDGDNIMSPFTGRACCVGGIMSKGNFVYFPASQVYVVTLSICSATVNIQYIPYMYIQGRG